MLYLDGFSLSFLKNELIEKVKGRKVTKIYQYDNQHISLIFNKVNLYFSINPELPLVYVSDKKEEAPANPLPFSLTLRKLILNGILVSVEQFGFDRILIFNFTKLNELGEINEYKLIIEIMGKHSNIILTDSNFKIIDLLKRFSLEENKLRILLPTAKYEFPVIKEKQNPYNISEEFYNKFIHSYSDILEKIEGFGKVSALEICESYDKYINFLNLKPQATIYFKNNQIKLAGVFKFEQFNNLENKEFNEIHDLINFYVNKTITSQQFNNKFSNLSKHIKKDIKKNEKILKKINKDLDNNQNYIKYKEIGDVLAANLYNIKSNQNEIELFNFYTNENIVITLDPRINPSDNLNNYYKKYNKLKRTEDFHIKRIAEIKEELAYLESVLSFLLNCNNITDLDGIEDELIDNNYFKKKIESKNRNKKKKKKTISVLEYTSSEGFTIFIGKNNKENENVTFKLSAKNDIWLHAKDIPGSHVLIKINSSENDLTDITISEAASIAAYYSKFRNEKSVPVDYTYKKHVKKPKGAKQGFVTYTHETGFTAIPKNLIETK